MNFPGVDHWTDIFAVIQRSFFDWLLKLMRKFNKEGLQSACFPGSLVYYLHHFHFPMLSNSALTPMQTLVESSFCPPSSNQSATTPRALNLTAQQFSRSCPLSPLPPTVVTQICPNFYHQDYVLLCGVDVKCVIAK